MADIATGAANTADHMPNTRFTSNPVSFERNQESKSGSNPRDRDSGVYLSDCEDSLVSPQSTSSTTLPRHVNSITRSDSTRIDRLRRPAELNLGAVTASPNPSRPKSELERRFDLIRNSSTRSKASLKSPTQLLKDRLNLSPKKEAHEITRVFEPPKPVINGCILPGPSTRMEAFTGKDVQARTEKGRPAWWCKFDKLVVFDGLEETKDGRIEYKTRSSKGLSIARRRGDCETVVIPMACAHCREMLNRSEWKYDVRVCKRSICWDCKERCQWEMDNMRPNEHDEAENEEREMSQLLSANGGVRVNESNRERADSVLQDEQVHEEELMRKLGVETGPKSPMEFVGGIDERLEEVPDVS